MKLFRGNNLCDHRSGWKLAHFTRRVPSPRINRRWLTHFWFLDVLRDFGITATSGHLCFSQNWQGKNWVLNFSWRFRRFSANKSSKQNAETEQARPQLYFAPKIIKIHLVVLENELIEVCMLISKHCQKLSRVCHALLCVLLIKRTFTKVSIHIHNLSCMKALHTRDLFWHFFGINMQTSINSFSKTAKWILMIFGAKWSWDLACSVSAFCLLLLFAANRRNLQEKFRTRFFSLPVLRKTQMARSGRDHSHS